MKASDLFIKALENEGVKYIFGVPGEENLDLVESIRTSSIELVTTRHEQAAGFMAATYGRLTGNTGVCMSTLGPGATNLVTAAAYAQLGGMPMMMITGQKPIKKSRQGRFQIVNVVDMMRPLTKFTKSIVNGNTIPSLIRECFRVSQEERPGAVHLELPEDIAREDTDEPLFAVDDYPQPTATDKTLDTAAAMIHHAKQPLLLIGAGANRKDVTKAIDKFIKKTSIPFFNTQMGKGVVDERHPLFMGTAALSSGDYVHCAINNADLIINIGHDITEKPPFLMQHDGAKVIHINYSSAHIDEVYFPNFEVVGDLSNIIDRLANKVEKQNNWDLSHFLRVKDSLDTHMQEKASDDRFPLLPQRIVADTRKVMPDDGILTLDNGMYKIWFARNYNAYQPNTILLDNALATMGAGLPSGIGTKFVHPERKVVAICGDGGFMMNAQSLETAVRLNLNMTILVLRDNSYGMIKWKQKNMKLPAFDLEFGNPDFVKFADCHGAHGHRVEKTEDYVKILQHTLDTPGVHLIEVPIDYSETNYDLGENLQAMTCQLDKA